MRRVACASVQLKFVVAEKELRRGVAAEKELRRGVVDATEYSC